MLSKVINGLVLLCVLQRFPVNCYSGNSALNRSSAVRHKRTLNFYFPYNSCYALAVVLSLPLEDLPAGRSAFCSYNFETNFYYPYFDNAAGIVPLPFTYIDEPGANAGTKHRIDLPPAYRQFSDADEAKKIENVDEKVVEAEAINKLKNETEQLTEEGSKLSINKPKDKVKKAKKKTRNTRSLLSNYFMSRRRFYKLMESKMDRSGLNGNGCILKAICETSQVSFGFHNGVLGSVIDVLFLPSTSSDEKLPKSYHQAEINGKSENCHLYDKKCPNSIFDFISKII